MQCTLTSVNWDSQRCCMLAPHESESAKKFQFSTFKNISPAIWFPKWKCNDSIRALLVVGKVLGLVNGLHFWNYLYASLLFTRGLVCFTQFVPTLYYYLHIQACVCKGGLMEKGSGNAFISCEMRKPLVTVSLRRCSCNPTLLHCQVKPHFFSLLPPSC